MPRRLALGHQAYAIIWHSKLPRIPPNPTLKDLSTPVELDRRATESAEIDRLLSLPAYRMLGEQS